MRKTKVLLLLHELSRTGAPKLAIEAFEAMRDTTEVRIVALADGPLREMASRLGPVEILREVEKLPAWRLFYYQRLPQRKWLNDLHRWAPDLIYANSVASLPIAARVVLPRVPSILHVHELRSHNEWALVNYPQLVTRWPSRYIAVSEAVARDLSESCKIERSRMSVIHEFVTERHFDDMPPTQLRSSGDRFVVGGCGHPTWRKGVTLWLQMAVELRRLIGDAARFVWVGVPGRPEGCPFRNQARLMGLEGAVEVLPETATPLVHFAKFDVFAMTSWEDPCPIVVLENMMLGKPVACFADGGGAPEEVGETGMIVDDYDPRAMARRIAELATNPQEQARLGALARDRVLKHFTDRVQAPKIRREMDNLLGRDSVRAPTEDSATALVGTATQ